MEPINQPVREVPVFERKKTGRVRPKRILFHVFTATLAVLLLYPVIWLFVSSFKESASIFTTSQHSY